jgi:hypothetical protein
MYSCWNVFLPASGYGSDVGLFYWNSWRVDVGTDDLAYMHGYPDYRRRSEHGLLDRYRHKLAKNGVAACSRVSLTRTTACRCVVYRNACLAGRLPPRPNKSITYRQDPFRKKIGCKTPADC